MICEHCGGPTDSDCPYHVEFSYPLSDNPGDYHAIYLCSTCTEVFADRFNELVRKFKKKKFQNRLTTAENVVE